MGFFFSFTSVLNKQEAMDIKQFIFTTSLLTHLFLGWIYNFYNFKYLVDIIFRNSN